MSDQRDPNEITYELILREVREGKETVAEAIRMFEERMANEDRLHSVRFALLENVNNEVQALRQQAFQIADAKTLAQQVQKDMNEHKADHKWWWGSIVSAFAGIGTALGLILKHSDKIADTIRKAGEIGKPPHP